ncbi:MAG: hypothetical protein JWP29_3538 [Rhodoferax sp.]|nr:hypothetical protein [Rhodoferax sp.]
MPLFDRVYKLIVGPAGGTGRIIASGEAGMPSLRITFDIEKTSKEAPNKSKVTIYNLAPETRKLLESPDVRLALYAGYTESQGAQLMASGNVTFGFTVRDGADWATVLEMHDGQVPLRDTMVSVGLGAGASAHAIIKDVGNQMGLPVILPDSAPDRTWAHGFSYYGPARTALRKATDGAGLEWSVQNEALQVVARNGTTSRQAIVISSTSGMIKSPERKREGAKETAKVADTTTGALPHVKTVAGLKPYYDGWRVNSLLQPTIVPGDPVKLESFAVNQVFRVEKVRHVGDSHGGDWQTQFDLLDPKDYAKEQADLAAKKAKTAARATGGGHH